MGECNRNKCKSVLKSEIEIASTKNDVIVAERFKLMMQIEVLMEINSNLAKEIELASKVLKTPQVTTRFHVGNLPQGVNVLILKLYFSSFGQVEDIFLKSYKYFAFVTLTFSNSSDLLSFFRMNHQIKGK